MGEMPLNPDPAVWIDRPATEHVPPELPWPNSVAMSRRHEQFNAVQSISLGELLHSGVFRWGDKNTVFDAYDTKTYFRLCQKIEDRYFDREISVLPPKRWFRLFRNTCNDLSAKYNVLYRFIDQGGMDKFLQTGDDYGKNRTVSSEFPATQLKHEGADYASNASDYEYERVTTGDWLSRMVSYVTDYQDCDKIFVDELDVLFTQLVTVNMNQWM